MPHKDSWFHHAVIYQIYPRSFYDTNGDGVGDLPGIIKKLDYLGGTSDSLGVDAIWLSPFYPSPMADFGYDVADYCNVDPLFGTLDDFKQLLAGAHERQMKIFIDFIPNHSSDEHPWFQASRSSRNDPKRDWYIWRDPQPDGTPPNNWRSAFGGHAWEFDKATGQYYLHSFATKQPDLNWDNPELREAMHNAVRFWLDLGVDGLRVDAVPWISKDPAMRDDPLNPHYNPDTDSPYNALRHVHSNKGPQLYQYLQELASVVAEYPDRFMVTEAYPNRWNDADAYVQYYEHINPIVSAPFNFEGIFAPWRAHSFKTFVDRFQHALKADYVPVYDFGNHDRPRLASRIGRPAARTAAMLLLTLPGMPIIYYGDELGMIDGVIARNQVQDTSEKTVPGKGLGRDPERTPLLWNAEANAGFTSGVPWLPINPDYLEQNAAAQIKDPQSFLKLYQKLLQHRRHSAALKAGTYEPLDVHANVFGYAREAGDEKIIVLLNFSGQELVLEQSQINGTVMLSTYTDHPHAPVQGSLTLRPHEGLMIAYEKLEK
jgi:alpha-glucosidase